LDREGEIAIVGDVLGDLYAKGWACWRQGPDRRRDEATLAGLKRRGNRADP
jgi:hypothetical protein